MSDLKSLKNFQKNFANRMAANALNFKNCDLNNSLSTYIHSADVSVDQNSPSNLLQGTSLCTPNFTNLLGITIAPSPTNSDYSFKQSMQMILTPKSESVLQTELQSDANYKTEMCRTWIEHNYCPYNEKCRFAHGKKELHDKVIVGRNYKQKDCKSFHTRGFCNYGSRCHFRHEQRRLSEIERTYYKLKLNCESTLFSFLERGTSNSDVKKQKEQKRLPIFNQISHKYLQKKKIENSYFKNQLIVKNYEHRGNNSKLLNDIIQEKYYNYAFNEKNFSRVI